MLVLLKIHLRTLQNGDIGRPTISEKMNVIFCTISQEFKMRTQVLCHEPNNPLIRLIT